MPLRYYANAPATTLANSCTALATSIVVSSTTGLPISYPYTLILDRGTATEEAVSVTAAAGTTLTVTRGIDSTTAFAHSAGATVAHGITAQDIREANTHVNTNSQVHGVTGSVVGTTDTQTLTNKTLSADSNTINGFAASSFVITDGTGKADGSAAQKAIPSGVVVGTTDTQTLTNKTMTAPTINGTVAGTSFGAWTSYSPTLTGFTVSSSQAYYREFGQTVIVHFNGLLNAAATGTMKISLPAAAARTPVAHAIVGTALANDAGTAFHIGAAFLETTTTVWFNSSGSGALWQNTIPHAWASGDAISMTITYERA